ncbi:MAG TPA: DUF1684 domain-containing protein [Bryobacteraceae bacterium]|nr:DUF1684 domain-containing protein [Bryobacteraceae bacterium]
MARVLKTGLAFLLLATCAASAAEDAYVAEIQKSRQESDAFMRSDRSPLRLVGRFQVAEGVATLGSDPASTILFPERAPRQIGRLTRRGREFRFEVSAGVPVTINGKPMNGAADVHVAKSPEPSDRVGVGDFLFAIRPVGEDFYLLLQDSKSTLLREFKGSTWFPVDTAYRVEAQFSPYEQKETTTVPFTSGDSQTFTAGGDVIFQLAGQTMRLKTFETSGGLFVMFRDQTSGKETYGGGRFLEAPTPQGGKTTLDFNKAYNPYCAFNPYAVCPVPPRENRLPVRIAAGETYQGHP